MALLSREKLIARVRRGREARARLVESNLDKGVAFQIRATREAQSLTQADLARDAGMTQNNISRLESPDYGKHTITSLKRIADALDVALVVRFVPFSQYISWLSGTAYRDEGLSAESLAVPSFEKEEKLGRIENTVLYPGTPKQLTQTISFVIDTRNLIDARYFQTAQYNVVHPAVAAQENMELSRWR